MLNHNFIIKLNQTKRKILYGISILFLAGCSQTQVYSCNDKAIQDQLARQLQPQDPLINVTIDLANRISSKSQNQLLTCRAQVSYRHKIFESALTVGLQYKVDDTGTLVQLLINPSDQDQLNEWYQKLPQVINYQKTSYGIMSVVQRITKSSDDHNQTQQLLFNNQPLLLASKNNYSSITIDQKFILNHKEVFLVSAYLNQQQDQSIDHNYLIGIFSESHVTISQVFSYQESSLHQLKNTILFNGKQIRPYAESNDYAQYEYLNFELNPRKAALPDSYYQTKFSKMNAMEILRQVKTDGCLNGDQFYPSDICSRKKITYCFQLKSIHAQPKNQAYILLHEMCSPYQFSD